MKNISLEYNFLCRFAVLLLFISIFAVGGCQTAYYKTLERVGIHKRDVLVSRVENARDAQQEAKEQFQSALERFSTTLNFDGGKLEEKYKTLNEAYEKSADKAENVHQRIDSVEDVAEALFDEWEEELNQYSSPNLRKASKQKLDKTRNHFSRLISAMKKAEKKINPVLSAFRDQVLFLKHNLNAQAIASLQNELISIESDIASLIKEMESSITEADAFIKAMLKE